MPGYTKQLLVLPFDHRASFQEKMFGIHGQATPEQTAHIASFKEVIYDGFEKAVESGLPREKMGILVDEQFGGPTLERARKAGFTICICAEKSGQDEFDFEYGAKYQDHIEKVNPEIVKVLVRYNPEGEKQSNAVQAARLAELGRYCAMAKRAYMFELLVPPTKAQLETCKGDKGVYDREMRPKLMVEAIHELQDAGVEADIWKLEGLDRTEDFQRVVDAAHRDGREDVGCILLGRGENDEKVRHWLTVGAKVTGVIGFAVGRTVWWEPLKELRDGKIDKKQAAAKIAEKYGAFCRQWIADTK